MKAAVFFILEAVIWLRWDYFQQWAVLVQNHLANTTFLYFSFLTLDLVPSFIYQSFSMLVYDLHLLVPTFPENIAGFSYFRTHRIDITQNHLLYNCLGCACLPWTNKSMSSQCSTVAVAEQQKHCSCCWATKALFLLQVVRQEVARREREGERGVGGWMAYLMPGTASVSYFWKVGLAMRFWCKANLIYTYHVENSCCLDRPKSFDRYTMICMTITKAAPLDNEIVDWVIS